ncbi:G-type lectin S-receptor-like serine/threonine-protein kinase [Morus notabilis]|uniref:Carboxymethylenebutenolidase homolog n=1 Tax=Morus notabilis TaxID=981085 RepID=W9R8I4_9ROSA|nr:G-type lectin S-receptor-like serine/threonine-protein kinase [Morus notabilis]
MSFTLLNLTIPFSSETYPHHSIPNTGIRFYSRNRQFGFLRDTEASIAGNSELFSRTKRCRFAPMATSMELPLLPFSPNEVLVPSESKTLHLYEARYLALLEESLMRRSKLFVHFVLDPIIIGDSSSEPSFAARYGCLVFIESADPYLIGAVVPEQDMLSEDLSGLSSKITEVKEALHSLNSLEIKLKAPKEALLQTHTANSLAWTEKEPSLDCDSAFIPSLSERVSFAGFQPVSGNFSSPSSVLDLNEYQIFSGLVHQSAEFDFYFEHKAGCTNQAADALSCKDELAALKLPANMSASAERIKENLEKDPTMKDPKLVEEGKIRQFWVEDGLVYTKGNRLYVPKAEPLVVKQKEDMGLASTRTPIFCSLVSSTDTPRLSFGRPTDQPFQFLSSSHSSSSFKKCKLNLRRSDAKNIARRVNCSLLKVEDGLDDDACELVSGKELSIEEGDDNIRAYLFKAVKNNNGTGILLLSDVYGFEDSATRDFAYRVACNGYNVLVPDLFRGDPWAKHRPKDVFEQWIRKQDPERVAKDIATSTNWMVNEFVAAGISKKLGLIGFCYGGGKVIDVLSRDQGTYFGIGVSFYGTRINPTLASNVKVPVLFISGDNDPLCPISLLEDVEKRIGRGSRVEIFKGRGHGFVHRPESPEEDGDAEQISSSALQLLETGNPVLIDAKNVSLWQSFDYPMDTIVMGQRHLVGKSLVSAATGDDLSADRSGIVVVRTDLLEAFMESYKLVSYMEITRNGLYLYGGENDSLVILRLALKLSDFRIARIGHDGRLMISSLNENSVHKFVRPIDFCLVPNICGELGLCTWKNTEVSQCTCQEGFRIDPSGCLPKENSFSLSRGCNTSVGGRGLESTSVAKYLNLNTGTNYYAINFMKPAKRGINLAVCQDLCLKNCSCLGISYRSSSSSCYLLENNIGSVYIDSTKSDLVLGNTKIFEISSFPSNTTAEKKRDFPIAGLVLIPLSGFGMIMAVAILWLHKKKSTTKKVASNLGRWNSSSSSVLQQLLCWDYLQDSSTTPDETAVAVKKITNLGVGGKKEFFTELAIIGSIYHADLVRLKGPILEWEDRFKIVLGMARALAYLHSGCQHKIIHCDVKPENILLNEGQQVRSSDFGLSKLPDHETSKLLTTLRGTSGYLAPEWLTSYMVSPTKSTCTVSKWYYSKFERAKKHARNPSGASLYSREVRGMGRRLRFEIWRAQAQRAHRPQ